MERIKKNVPIETFLVLIDGKSCTFFDEYLGECVFPTVALKGGFKTIKNGKTHGKFFFDYSDKIYEGNGVYKIYDRFNNRLNVIKIEG